MNEEQKKIMQEILSRHGEKNYWLFSKIQEIIKKGDIKND